MKTTTKAMLFGGTLIAVGLLNAQEATAEVVWNNGVSYTTNWVDYSVGYGNWSWDDVFGDTQLTGEASSNGVYGTILNGIGQTGFTGVFDLDVETTFDVSLTSGLMGFLGSNSGGDVDVDFVGIDSITLEAGSYWLNFFGLNTGSESYSFLEAVAVPAPGALALLGLAGVCTRRRRK
jgi:MYXO-CTERM domain-containing protein